MQKTAYQILIKIYPTETCTITSKLMTLDKLFIMKQSIIIYKIQARFIRPKSACVPSTNTSSSLFHETTASRRIVMHVVRSSELGHAVTMEL